LGVLPPKPYVLRDVVSAPLEGKTRTAAWRLFRNISQTELAQKAGVSCTGLSSIERGLSSGNQLRPELADALAVPAEALIV
jgi:transcriptional regulator with XRE-family HTH domain